MCVRTVCVFVCRQGYSPLVFPLFPLARSPSRTSQSLFLTACARSSFCLFFFASAKHRHIFLPHASRSPSHRLPRPTHNTVPRARVVESYPSENYLQQCLDRRRGLLTRRDFHSHVQRDTAVGPSVKWNSR